jgi:toxin FitB
MYLLDTNIVSMLDPRRRPLAPELIKWLEDHGASLYISVITVSELDAGALKLRRENKSVRADEFAELLDEILTSFANRVLAVDIETARMAASLGELTYQQRVGFADLYIAATAMRHGLTVLTHNIKEFSRLGVAVLDPLVALPPSA